MANEYQATILISDYKRLIRELNRIEPELTKQLRKDLKDIAEGPRDAVRKAIPAQPPIRGMRRKLSPVGKTWNTRRRARTVTIRTKSPKRSTGFGAKPAAIVQLQVTSPATIIADMAGRGKMKSSIDGGKTDWYVYPNAKGTTENTRPGKRRHTVNGQGYAMVRALGDNASRYAYPALEKVMPDVQRDLYNTLDEAARLVEREANG